MATVISAISSRIGRYVSVNSSAAGKGIQFPRQTAARSFCTQSEADKAEEAVIAKRLLKKIAVVYAAYEAIRYGKLDIQFRTNYNELLSLISLSFFPSCLHFYFAPEQDSEGTKADSAREERPLNWMRMRARMIK